MDPVLTKEELAALFEEVSTGLGREDRSSAGDQRAAEEWSAVEQAALDRLLFSAVLGVLLARSETGRVSLSLIKVRLGGLERFREQSGDLEADRLLSQLGLALRRSSRMSDPVLISGRNEFGMICLGQSEDQARLVAGRCLKACREMVQQEAGSGALRPRVEVGLATHGRGSTSAAEMIARVEEALALASKRGGDRLEVAGRGERRHPRFPIRLGVRLKPLASSQDEVNGSLTDISVGGFSVETEGEVEIQGEQQVFLDWPDQTGCGFLSARPIWTRKEHNGNKKQRRGFAFQPQSEEVQAQVRAMIIERLKEACLSDN